jgi:hypothetical protein
MDILQDDLEMSLNALIQEYGFVAVLEGLRDLVQAKATAIGDPSDEQVKAFGNVVRSLTILLKVLPEEMDAKIALEQLTHVVPDVEPDETKLTGGLE